MSSDERYKTAVKFIRGYHKSFDPVTQFCVEAEADVIRAILFPRRRWE